MKAEITGNPVERIWINSKNDAVWYIRIDVKEKWPNYQTDFYGEENDWWVIYLFENEQLTSGVLTTIKLIPETVREIVMFREGITTILDSKDGLSMFVVKEEIVREDCEVEVVCEYVLGEEV